MSQGAAKPLAPEQLARDFGLRSPLFGRSLADQSDLPIYFALLIERIVEHVLPGRGESLSADLPTLDSLREPSEGLSRLRELILRTLEDYATEPADCPQDLFKPLYQSLFTQSRRRRLGEFYTPDWLAEHVLDQLGYSGDPAARLLDPACGTGTFLIAALRKMMSKAAGGRCLVASDQSGQNQKSKISKQISSSPPALTLTLSQRELESPNPRSPEAPIPENSKYQNLQIGKFPLCGFDLNPLAVLAARANLLLAAARLLPKGQPFVPPIYLRDSILDGGKLPGGRKFDFVVGNPPWIAWDKLPAEMRQATAALWRHYGLFSLSGNHARHGGGKKDLAMLMLYAAADRFLADGGRLGMVITQTVFQTLGAGDGFRRFRIGAEGQPLKVLRVDDLTELRPFGPAAVRTATIVLEKGSPTVYPVPYVVWGTGDEGRGAGGREIRKPCIARPVAPSKITSPWIVLDDKSRGTQPACDVPSPPAPLPQAGEGSCCPSNASDNNQFHLGVNSGGANGVFWVEVLEHRRDGVLVRNLPARGKLAVETVEWVVEPDLLFPLLRWGDIGRYRVVPRCCVILAQDPLARTGIDPAVMREKYPRTLAYFERFKELLLSRAAYRRYQNRGPFYSMYNVGPYSIAPIKVVWRRMDRRLTAAVVEPPAGVGQDDIWLRPFLPQETCCLAVCQSSDEAHYLCALLNSAAINDLAARQGIRGGKGFGSPSMIAHLPLGRFYSSDGRHIELASLSRQAHAEAADGDDTRLAELQRRMDRLSAG
jgi:hypothetical protein